MSPPTASGLDGVVVANTASSDVDGEHGRLVIRGYAVEDLVERASFEEACALLWNGVWPSAAERDSVRTALAEARAEAVGQRAGAFARAGARRVLVLRSPMFAASRVVGWCAHVDEQRAVGRLIRPASVYVGL